MLKKLVAFCIIILIVFQTSVVVSAESVVDMEKKGSVSVRVVCENIPLEGMKLNCIQIGKLMQTESGYYFACIYDSSIKFTADNIHNTESAGKMLDLVKKENLPGNTENVDQHGTAVFSELTAGLYLIYQTEVFAVGGDEYTVSPFLVTIPYDGEYDVDAKSKPSLDIIPEETTEPTTPPDDLPQTGQLSWPIPILACSGMICFILGWYLCFSNRKDPNET